jgi:hypothetical protein
MNKEELKGIVQLSINENAGIEIFLGLKNGEIRKANFIDEVQKEIKNVFIDDIEKRIIESEYPIMCLSSSDERKDIIYHFDYTPLPDDLEFFDTVLDPNINIKPFSFENDKLNNIDFFLFLIGDEENRILLYKQLAPINIYKKNSGIFVRKADNEFTRVNDDFLRIVPGFELFKVNGELYILDLKFLERKFKIYDVIKSVALKEIDKINEFGIVQNANSLKELLINTSFARKLSKISEHSPVLGKVPNADIISFTKNYPKLKNKFKYTNDGSQIILSTKTTMEIFIKLLNDDFLSSELTRIYYDSIAKDELK